MENLYNIIEAILFVSGDGIAIADIAEKLEISEDEVKECVEKIKADRLQSNSGIQLIEYNKKIQLCTNKDYAEYVAQVLNPIREKKLSKLVMEVCGIVAYKQPITRLEIEKVRGNLNCDYAINFLLENDLIEVVGRKDAIGKPMLYGTTDKFLKKFGLESIDDLPDYEQLVSRIKILEETPDSSLFNYNNIPTDEELTDEQQNEIIQGIKETKEEIIKDREYLDDVFNKYSDDLNNIPQIDLNKFLEETDDETKE